MEVIPAVDLREGKCVRLNQGKAGTETLYFPDPLDAARQWVEQGARRLHLIDLDATLGLGNNEAVIRRIVETVPVKVQVGGGIRSVEKALALHAVGVDRVIIGTMAIKDPAKIETIARAIGTEHVVVALDHVGGKVAIKGWTEQTQLDACEFAREMERRGAGHVLMTSIQGDGMFTGPDLDATREMIETVSIPVIAAGGIHALEDLQNLEAIGTAGAVIGKALYEGKITLEAIGNYF